MRQQRVHFPLFLVPRANILLITYHVVVIECPTTNFTFMGLMAAIA